MGALAPAVERFAYDRAALKTGIVHLGIGAFHRAHQAWYTDRAIEATGDADWGISGVSLRSSQVAEQLYPQRGLYTVTERSGERHRTRLIGAVRDVLVTPGDPEAVIARLAAPDTRIVSLTVTEKGYCRRAEGGLDRAQAGPNSLFALLGTALRRRHDGALPGLTLLSCDNLADNGRQLEQLMREYLDAADPALARWFDAECACPSTMVDRIVPATTEGDRAELAGRIGLADEGAVMTEPFSQWVVEDRFAGPRPAWERAGVELVADVRPYEVAKLRMLNGAHSALAYIGLGRGHGFVHEAMADPAIRPLIERLMLIEAAPTVDKAPGQDLAAYAGALASRFDNPELKHRLIQIAMDGSQKIPQRWLETLAANARAGRACPAILAGLAGWLRHLRGDNGAVDDPRSEMLARLWQSAGKAGIVPALFGPNGAVSSIWTPSGDDVSAVMEQL